MIFFGTSRKLALTHFCEWGSPTRRQRCIVAVDTRFECAPVIEQRVIRQRLERGERNEADLAILKQHVDSDPAVTGRGFPAGKLGRSG